jgi:hypothetical protein
VPRYFFDLYNDMDVLDEEGKELPDIDAAKATALCEVREMVLASIADDSELNLCHYINVRDEGGAIVYVMRFQDAVTIKRGGKVLSQPSANVLRCFGFKLVRHPQQFSFDDFVSRYARQVPAMLRAVA